MHICELSKKSLLNCLFIQRVENISAFFSNQIHQVVSPSTAGGGQDAGSKPSLESTVCTIKCISLFIQCIAPHRYVAHNCINHNHIYICEMHYAYSITHMWSLMHLCACASQNVHCSQLPHTHHIYLHSLHHSY